MTEPPRTTHPLAGRYVLVDQIGAGGMGSVWRAWDLRSQRFVAAKILGQHDGSMLLRFVREQSVRISHPHVVAPSGWAADDDLVVFTMDLVPGGSVETLLGDHGPLPESYVAVLLDQLLQALVAVHGAGVVHRDIKPANLLLEVTGTRRPHLRLGDFGVAALVDDVRLTRFPGGVGTDGYMAPEEIAGAAPDPRQDLYAAGVVAVQMLTGRAPHQQPASGSCPPGPLKPLLDAMTSDDPDRRPPSARAALDYLRRVGVPDGAPWQADPEPPEVFDQLGEGVVPPGAASGTPSGAPGSGVPAATPPSAPATPPPGGPVTPGYAASLAYAGPTFAPGGPPGPGTAGAPAGATSHTADRASQGRTQTLVAVVCFLVSIGLCAAALVLLLS